MKCWNTYDEDYSFDDSVFEYIDFGESTDIEPDDFSYQEISVSKIAGLQGLLNDTGVSHLKIGSKSVRGNLQKIDAATFKKLVDLVELEVNNHKVKNIDKRAFEKNVDLMKIDFSDNEISDLDPELFKNLLQLREVNFQQNRLRSLPENLFEKNVDLEMINFAHNEIQKVPKKLLDKLENLEEIYLNDNRIKIISDQFFKKTNLMKVQLSNNRIEKIEVSGVVRKIDFNNLLEINLSNNKLKSLPSNIFNGMNAIQILDFSNNEISEIPRDFPDNFQEIILNGNKIRKIHDSLYKNKKNLKNLALRENQIDEIFVSQEKTRNVGKDKNDSLRINLSANNLKVLKPFTFASIKSNLMLDISENSLKLLPKNLFDGSKVGKLNFANNLIEELESNTFENARLDVRKVDFSNNKIEILDEKLFDKWIDIYELNFGHNQIKVLPEKLFDVKCNMHKVSFVNNQISKIGYNTFAKCNFLADIDLRNNTCFDLAFFYGSRQQHEVCSDNCEKSCFIVNGYLRISAESGIFRSRKACQAGKTRIRNVCRFTRKRQG